MPAYSTFKPFKFSRFMSCLVKTDVIRAGHPEYDSARPEITPSAAVTWPDSYDRLAVQAFFRVKGKGGLEAAISII